MTTTAATIPQTECDPIGGGLASASSYASGAGIPNLPGVAESLPRVRGRQAGKCLPEGPAARAAVAAGDPESADKPSGPAERRIAG